MTFLGGRRGVTRQIDFRAIGFGILVYNPFFILEMEGKFMFSDGVELEINRYLRDEKLYLSYKIFHICPSLWAKYFIRNPFFILNPSLHLNFMIQRIQNIGLDRNVQQLF